MDSDSEQDDDDDADQPEEQQEHVRTEAASNAIDGDVIQGSDADSHTSSATVVVRFLRSLFFSFKRLYCPRERERERERERGLNMMTLSLLLLLVLFPLPSNKQINFILCAFAHHSAFLQYLRFYIACSPPQQTQHHFFVAFFSELQVADSVLSPTTNSTTSTASSTAPRGRSASQQVAFVGQGNNRSRSTSSF
jgi:hypothetical protein